jgi:long-chain acyl-CoA synthetase
VRLAYTSGTAVSPDVIRYFRAIGVPLIQIYGSSECGVATMHPRNQVKPETCGTPLDGYEITISETGEILVRSGALFKGYHKDPERTARALGGAAYHTGDFGRFDADGHLIVMDRLDDLQKIGAGRVFSPQYAETRIRFSPFIKDVLVVGREGRESAVALVNIDARNVGQWAEKRRIVYTTFADLSQKKEVIDLVEKEISAVNAYLPEYARIGRFLNLHKEFDPDEEEMTRTRKVRREFMEKKYRELIDALYGEDDRIEVAATVAYRDGSVGQLKSAVLLNTLPAAGLREGVA